MTAIEQITECMQIVKAGMPENSSYWFRCIECPYTAYCRSLIDYTDTIDDEEEE